MKMMAQQLIQTKLRTINNLITLTIMKKFVLLSVMTCFTVLSFGQKKEVKALEKAVNSNNFGEAKSAVSAAEALLPAMDDKTKAKFYFNKAKALYANGGGSDSDISAALESMESLKGNSTYAVKISELKSIMANNFINKGQDAIAEDREVKDYTGASLSFERAYQLSTIDTLFLYNAALLASSDKNYDRALGMFEKLSAMGYTGIATTYSATNKETGEEDSFPTKTLRDISVKSGTHINPKEDKSTSKAGDIAKNVALIYIAQDNSELAIASIEKAKSINPGDINLILAESNIRYKLGELDKYEALVKQALDLDPDNVDLVFNLGVVANEIGDLENAKKYYNQVVDMDPTYSKANMNMAAMILDQEAKIIEEMNGLGTSAADDKRYEELRGNRQQLYKDAIPYLKNVLQAESKNLSAAKTLMNIYSALDDQANFEAMKSKVAEIEEGGN